jgi:hypothetical protein
MTGWAIWNCIMFGSFWFWAIIAIWVLVEIIAVAHDEGGWAFGTFLVVFLAWFLFGEGNLLVQIAQNWKLVLIAMGAYMVVGTIWSLIKWRLFASKKARKYNELKTKWFDKNAPGKNLADLSEQEEKVFWESIANSWGGYHKADGIKKEIVPSYLDHKEDILVWMIWWPFSLFWTVFDDLLKQLGEIIMHKLRHVFTNVAKGAFGKDLEDFQS